MAEVAGPTPSGPSFHGVLATDVTQLPYIREAQKVPQPPGQAKPNLPRVSETHRFIEAPPGATSAKAAAIGHTVTQQIGNYWSKAVRV